MNTDFPEQLFNPKNISLYKYKINEGKNLCKNKSIVFCGIARNVDRYLKRNIQRLHRTGSMFKDYEIFIYENDSTDNTIKVLQENKSNNLNYICEKRQDKDYQTRISSGEDPWHYNRCVVLSECRNKYLEYLKGLSKKFDYVCILDLDLKGGWSYDGVHHGIFVLERDDKYGCVSSYGVLADKDDIDKLEQRKKEDYVMYDSFAFRPKNWRKGLHLLFTPAFNSINVSRGDDPFEVESNFGGMTIYKYEAIINKTYGAKQWAVGYVDPDHVVLNRKLIDDGWKIIFDPSMIVSYADHQYSIGET